MALALAALLLTPATSHAAVSLSVNLASATRAATSVGEGFLYGLSQDGTQPPDQFVLPLGITGQRGGGHAGGWIGDGYTFGSGTKADVNEVIAQARRVTQSPYHAQYQVIMADLYGADGSQPANTMWPCDNGSCANFLSFIDSVVGAIQSSGVKVAYDIWNEPDLGTVFWGRGFDTTQYFQMWDTAAREIRRIASGALIVGPSMADTPQQNASGWQNWLAHTKAAGTLPNEISNHLEGDGDDPVAVAQSINNALASNGISSIPLSANEFLPQNQQTAGQSAWYLARFAQSGYANALRGNWDCCLIPNLTGIVNQSGSSFSATGQWWTFRTYADLTGSLVSTSGQVGSTAISAAEDSSRRRAVAVVGDINGITGGASVTFTGLSSVPWLANNGTVNVSVYRIPDQSPLNSPQLVSSQITSTSGGSITVPFTFQASHDAFAIYLAPGFAPGFSSTLVNKGNGLCMDEFDWTTVAAAQFDQWTCNGGTNQQFSFVPVSAGSSTYFIHPMTPGYCLDVGGASTASGAAIDQWACNYNSNEQFTLRSAGTNLYQVVAQNSGLCVAPSGDSAAIGASLVQVSCTSAATRTWTIQVG
jgi:hypothetical protein